MVEHFKYFIGKLCTVMTVDVNFKFKYEQMTDYFTGIVESVNSFGIVLIHHATKCKNLISFNHIVSIHEEQVLFPSNPEDAKIIDQYNKDKPILATKMTIEKPPSQFIDPTALSNIASKFKK